MNTDPYIFSNEAGARIEVQSEDHETFFFQITEPSSLVDVFRYNIKSGICAPEDIKATSVRTAAITHFIEHFCFEIG